MKTPLILIDASNLAFRCHHVNKKFNPVTKTREPFSFNGHITSATYGFFKSLFMVKREYPESHLICAFDSRSEARHEIVREAKEDGILEDKHTYKGTRDRGSDDYAQVLQQLDELQETLPLTCVQVVKLKGYEADDIVGTYSKRFRPCVIVSADQDFHQLLDDEVEVYDPMKQRGVRKETILEEFKIEPYQMAHVGAIKGDVSDNIPGVPGVGPVGALKIIQEHQTVQKALEQIPLKKKPSKAELLLLEHRERALTSLKLKEILTDLPVPDPCPGTSNLESLRSIFLEQWGFKSLLPQIQLLK